MKHGPSHGEPQLTHEEPCGPPFPTPESLEQWAYDYVRTTSLAHKLRPPEVPERAAGGPALRLERPGRPPELRLTWRKYKAPRSAEALRAPQKRAQLLHTFFHHELQAAELMCWAVLAFPETPSAFRRGLTSICLDEIRHMGLYADHIARLGFGIGQFPVRDWFWQRAPSAQTPGQFVALMGMGFEAGNLDHAPRFARLFAEAGDARAAQLQEQIGEEEVRHVAFGVHWFEQLQRSATFAAWLAALPAPLSPMVMRGQPLSRERRARAGMSAAFLDQLERWQPTSPGC